jgi:hypothetical protein
MASEQGYVNIRSLQGINSLLPIQITSLEEAESYVERVADLCGVQGPVLRGELLPRLAKAELAAAQDPSQLIPDDRVADAFNFLSEEFRVPHPQRLTGTDVLQFRTAMAAIYPLVFSGKDVPGSRPTQALITLHQLIFNGVPEGAKKFAQRDPRPGSFKVKAARSTVHRSPDPAVREYRIASMNYFRGLNESGMHSLVESIARIMALPVGK